MKTSFLLVCLFAICSLKPSFCDGSQKNMIAQEQIQWQYYRGDQLPNNPQHKPFLLFFTGSDWCHYCKVMVKEVFNSPDFIRTMGNEFVFVEVDFPMKGNLSSEQQMYHNRLKQQFGVTGYPTVVILDAQGNFVAQTGYRPGTGGQAYAQYLKQLIQ